MVRSRESRDSRGYILTTHTSLLNTHDTLEELIRHFFLIEDNNNDFIKDNRNVPDSPEGQNELEAGT